MFDQNNPYTLLIDDNGEEKCYFAVFTDGAGKIVTTEISHELASLMFGEFVRYERMLKRRDERYLEQSALTDETLSKRAKRKECSLEDAICQSFENEQLYRAIDSLPEIQKRRLKLYYFENMTFEQIGELEGCRKIAVKFSVERAKEKLKSFFEK